MRINNSKIKKNNRMYACIVFSWLFCLAHFDPKLFSILREDESLITIIFYVTFVLFLNLFWLYGIFHCVIFIFKIFSKKKNNPTSGETNNYPTIAILYTTKNDFRQRAVLSCVKQTYPSFHIFILDDSTDDDYKSMVDQFHNNFKLQTTVIRRKNRKGFKAGNLNNALQRYATDYEYFAVIDADEVIPHDFLKKSIHYFTLDENIAFVQANHEQNPHQLSQFAEDLALGIKFHWDVYQPPRNDYGFVVFYGHGALIRRSVWEEIGGFPEIVSEDLAFSTRIRQAGYRGYFASEITCYEDFPETYHQFRKRYEKWVKGACEYLHREFMPFFRSNRVTIPEKVDVLFSCLSLFIPALFLIYIFVANAILPILLAENHTLFINLFGYEFRLMGAYFMEPMFANLWTIDFYLITFLTILSPIFCYCLAICSHPLKMTKLLVKSTVPYVALISVSISGLLSYFLTKKAAFLTTGDKTSFSSSLSQSSKGIFWEKFNSTHPLIFKIEFILGLALTYVSFMTMNLLLLTISSCFILSPLIARYGWENRVLSLMLPLPILFFVLVFGLTGTNFLGIQGFSLFFLALHF